MFAHIASKRIVISALFVAFATLGGLATAQTKWAQASPSVSPQPRVGSCMAYDAARQRVVLFGGATWSGQANDTWQWDGVNWIQCHPATSPPVRSTHAMTYDSARRRVVLFGGWVSLASPLFLNDTWEWDGTNWTQCHPATSPPGRSHHAMAYDSSRRRIVLFGGWAHPQHLNDTWEWDGANWVQCAPSLSPRARLDHALVYDAASQRTLLWGGGGTQFHGDTWVWDGINWVALTPTSSPSPRTAHALTWDEARQRVVLFGGNDASNVWNDTWEWDGVDWIPGNIPASPPGRCNHAMVCDAIKGTVLLFGGTDLTSRPPMGDTWQYAPCDLVASSGRVSVSTGGSVKFALDAGAPLGGKVYWLLGCVDSAVPRGIRAGNVTLLLNPDPYFWFTAQYPNPLMPNSLGQLDAAGRATATLLVPKGLPGTLVGTRFFHAYVAFQSRIDYASTPVPLTLVP